MITLHDRSDPAIGEVYFTFESGSDQWFCLLKDGRFFELLMEN